MNLLRTLQVLKSVDSEATRRIDSGPSKRLVRPMHIPVSGVGDIELLAAGTGVGYAGLM